MNYAIEVLEDAKESEERYLFDVLSKEMKQIYESNIEDLELAIHNLKMLDNI